MKIICDPPSNQWKALCARPIFSWDKIESIVSPVLEEIQKNGDRALRQFTARWDGVEMDDMLVSKEEFAMAESQLSEDLREAIELAAENIKAFHQLQLDDVRVIETMPGVLCWQRAVAIEKVGLYIPGGTAPLFSTVLMLAIPAKIAGCRSIQLCTPPRKDGTINPEIIYAASVAGVSSIYKVGGAQAIGAFTFGTETIESVYKIFGPGNQYVTAAKQLAQKQGVAIDLPAGPSEVLVIADESADPAFVAADLLAQAEHGKDSQVVLITTAESLVKPIMEALDTQLEQLPRKALAQVALDNSFTATFTNDDLLISFVNAYAPEHLIISTKDADTLADKIINAGSVFIGHLTPESIGDYASGTNHTLPTNGYARAYSGVNLDAFCKKITYQKITAEGIKQIGPAVIAMAKAEQLDGHAKAVSIRLNKLPQSS